MATEHYGSGPRDRTYADQPITSQLNDTGFENPRMNDVESRSLGDLFGDLSADMSELLRKEVALTQAEVMAKASVMARGASTAAVGGLVAYGGLILLLIALSFFLAQWMEFWVASGIVAIVTLLIGLIMLQAGRSRVQNTSLTPEQTIESLKDDVQWAKEQVQ